MNTNELLERRIRVTLAALLEAEPLPHPTWADAPAAARVPETTARRNRWPLRLLAIAALLVVGFGTAMAGAWLLRPMPANLSSPPADGWVAYASGDKDDSDIVFARPGGIAVTAIGAPGDGVGQSCPAFSPDGQFVAWNEDSPNATSWSLAVAQLGDDGLPGPAPRRFAFAKDQNVNGRLGLSNAEFVRGEGAPECPQWAPDGSRIAVVMWSGLRVVDLSSGAVIKLGPFGLNEEWPDGVPLGTGDVEWSPDSSRIAFTRAAGPGSETELWVATIAGEESLFLEAIPNEQIHELDWSASGKLAMAGGSVTELGPAFGRILDVARGATRPVDIDPGSGAGGAFDGLGWAPDGGSVSYIRDDALIVQKPGSTGIRLPPLQVLRRDVHPTCLNGWSPSGQRLLVVAYDNDEFLTDGRTVLLSVDASGQSDPVVVRDWEPGWPYGICGVTSWQAVGR